MDMAARTVQVPPIGGHITGVRSQKGLRLGDNNLYAGFTVLDEHPAFSLSGDGRRITLEFLENYRYAQIFAPKGKDFVALEPMTAPTSALTSRQGLRLVEPDKSSGQHFAFAFRHTVCIDGDDRNGCKC
jgi:galactose mutarotase-like enzyme